MAAKSELADENRYQSSKIEEPEEPPHYIVQQQLQDVILAQQAAYDKLKKSIEDRGESVPIKQYETVLHMLEEEQMAHAKTKEKLLDTEDKLEFARGEIEILTKQIEREKVQFEKSFGVLKSKALKETCKNVELETKCEDIVRDAESAKNNLGEKEAQIASLTERLQRQSDNYEREVAELTIQRMQDAYINRVLDGQDSSRRHPPARRKPKQDRQRKL